MWFVCNQLWVCVYVLFFVYKFYSVFNTKVTSPSVADLSKLKKKPL